jgi:predicted DNA-binding transcriptional regulator YafY
LVGKRMEATRGTLVLLRLIADKPMTQHELLDALQDEGLKRDERTLRRWLEALREAGFDLRREDGRYELRGSPVRLPLRRYEALATLNILGSFAAREPVYGRHLASAVSKLRDAIPEESLRFADSGSIEFAVSSASDPPEDPEVIDTLRRATRQSRRVEILYHSLQSETVRPRTVEPVRVAYAQRAHRLYASGS